MKRSSLILFFFAFQLVIIAQSEFGVKINFGISRVDANRDLLNIQSKLYFAPSAQGGFFYEFNLGKHSVLGAEILFSQIEGKEKMTINYDDGFVNYYTEDGYLNLDYHLSYLVMPFTYGFKLKKTTVSLGVQFGYEIANGVHEEGDMPYMGTRVKYEQDGEINTNKFDFGARASLFYDLNDRFTLEANYYHGLINVLASNGPGWVWKNKQATIGLRYTFLKK